MSTAPTPETDQQTHDPYYHLWDGSKVKGDMEHDVDGYGDWVPVEHARRLEQERDAARAEAAMWKANHDNQVKIKSILCQRPDLRDRAERISKLIEERDALARWKTEALSVDPPWQEIGAALGLTLGATIHDKILPGIQALQANNADLVGALRYARRWLKPADHDTVYLDGVLAKNQSATRQASAFCNAPRSAP